MPIAPEAEAIDELEQGDLALELHDAVELGNELECLLWAQAGEVTADGEVTLHAGRPQIARERLEAMHVELEDQREADEHGRAFAHDASRTCSGLSSKSTTSTR